MSATHIVPGLSFDEATLERRRQTLGASEIAAVAGLNPKRTALDVYLEKKAIVPPFGGNEFTEWGLRLEGAIAQKYAEVTGRELATSDSVTRDGWMSATPDRLVVANGEIARGLEIKRFGDYRADDFGVPGTDQIPLDVAAQVMWSMLVVGAPVWDVAVLLGQADFRIYTVEFDADAASALYDAGRAFWFEHLLANVEPAIDGSASARRSLQQRFAFHGEGLIEPTPEVISDARALTEIREEVKALEDAKARIEHRLQLAIGHAAGIRGVATWKMDRTGRPRWKDIAEALGASKPEHAPLIERYTSAPSRRFIFKFSEG